MLYTLTAPTLQTDRIRLYPSVDTALAEHGDARIIFAVAVSHDARSRRVVPLWTDPRAFDPAWMTPAEYHADESITAKGPIPQSLFALLDLSSSVAEVLHHGSEWPSASTDRRLQIRRRGTE